MKHYTTIALAGIIFLSACRQHTPIVEKTFTDSLLKNYTLPAAVKSTEADITFWKSRINPSTPGFVNELRYASTLVSRFHQLGNIGDMKMADSVLQTVNANFNQKETAPNIALCNNAILQHRFTIADSCLDKARKLGLKKYEALTASFDVDFELGRYNNTALYLQQLKPYADYGYYFRLSKLEHLNGNIDKAVEAMLKAASLAENSVYLKCAALSNAADLYMHEGELQKAYDLYKTCVKMNSADYHSITGIGWIALVQDKNDSLAQNLFNLVHANNKLPDPLFKMYQAAQLKDDSSATLRYAKQFSEIATNDCYGKMYNKYLIEVYTGILNNSATAVNLAKKELDNRSTPQTNCWYAYALFKNGQKEEAYKVYEQAVSGKPLETLELYWMGKMMEGLGKGYNAKEYFKAAAKNKFDLNPSMIRDLEKQVS